MLVAWPMRVDESIEKGYQFLEWWANIWIPIHRCTSIVYRIELCFEYDYLEEEYLWKRDASFMGDKNDYAIQHYPNYKAYMRW